MRLLNWYLMRFCIELLIGYWRTRRRALASVSTNRAFAPPVIAPYHYSDFLSDVHFFSSFIRRFRWDW